MENSLNLLSRRAGFNTALRHFKSVNEFALDVSEDGLNLADTMNDALEAGTLERFQVRAIVNALLVEKLGYVYETLNLEKTIERADDIVSVTQKWGKIHFVLCYYHPQAGLFVVNPAEPDHWEGVLPLVKDEYMVVFAGPASRDVTAQTLQRAASDLVKVIYGRTVKNDAAYLGRRRVLEPEAKPAPAPSPAAAETKAAAPAQPVAPAQKAGSKKRITPRYSVVVTNELFHNGNVEAWKKIIASFQTKYPGLDVLIWYENERINDINSLFKWGKVKHGVPILFSVAGDDIKEVRKLQRYLYEGASPRFEAFLKGGIDRVLDLF
jgi:hypothetical protein